MSASRWQDLVCLTGKDLLSPTHHYYHQFIIDYDNDDDDDDGDGDRGQDHL